MKTRDFFGETSPQTVSQQGDWLIPVVLEQQICRLECKMRPASVFGELSAAWKIRRIGFCFLQISTKNSEHKRSICISLHKYAFKKI